MDDIALALLNHVLATDCALSGSPGTDATLFALEDSDWLLTLLVWYTFQKTLAIKVSRVPGHHQYRTYLLKLQGTRCSAPTHDDTTLKRFLWRHSQNRTLLALTDINEDDVRCGIINGKIPPLQQYKAIIKKVSCSLACHHFCMSQSEVQRGLYPIEKIQANQKQQDCESFIYLKLTSIFFWGWHGLNFSMMDNSMAQLRNGKQLRIQY